MSYLEKMLYSRSPLPLLRREQTREVEGSRFANSKLTVVLWKSNATAMFMGTASKWLEICSLFGYPYSMR